MLSGESRYEADAILVSQPGRPGRSSGRQATSRERCRHRASAHARAWYTNYQLVAGALPARACSCRSVLVYVLHAQ